MNTTTATCCFSATVEGEAMFLVAPGKPVQLALHEAAHILAGVDAITSCLPEVSGNLTKESLGYAAATLTKLAMATICACIDGIEQEAKEVQQ